jgi:hypothetical protein
MSADSAMSPLRIALPVFSPVTIWPISMVPSLEVEVMPLLLAFASCESISGGPVSLPAEP